MSEPIGPQYGLTPLKDHTAPEPVYDSRDLLRNDIPYNDPTATEYGGVAGLIQPSPHVPTSSERLHAIYAISPTDPGTGNGSVAPPELEGAFNSE